MITGLPFYVYTTFIIAVVSTLLFLYYATQKNYKTFILIGILGGAQSWLAFNGFFLNTTISPSPFLLLFPPALIIIVFFFITKKGNKFIDRLSIKHLTILHTIRIPIELILYWIYIDGYIPELMTFEGKNFDILAGISAPFIYYFGYVKKRLNRSLLITWNLICLCLLLSIIIISLLTAPLPFQQFSFDQPNVGVLYFPFVWLPGIIVPIVLFAHLVTIHQLIRQKSKRQE